MILGNVSDRPGGLKSNKELGEQGFKQIPDASEQLTQKSHENLKKYAMFGIVIYLLCC